MGTNLGVPGNESSCVSSKVLASTFGSFVLRWKKDFVSGFF